MTGDGATVGMPLRPGDPTQLGEYKLLSRLGEGGMGSVYLARSATARRVALKVIRADLADSDEFRRRFRSEVARAQEVPPFCTAEVLDADPDHETPYLVVEYVDGPSLAEVVLDHGPLTPANLHGLAIGVATALAAIHGAGVIHRDLKPSNVLLAPGTPKVIDFGIARADGATDGETRTDQLIGTVAYMAPERLDPAVERTLTSAADIFAWGAVVAFAATGRVPFEGESSPATAVAILTKKPNLDGITEPLRDLVRRALAKNPKSRPTARELLDELLSTRPRRVLAATPVAPEVEAAEAETADVPAEDVAAEQPTDKVDPDDALTSGLAAAIVDVTAEGVIPPVPRSPVPVEEGVRPTAEMPSSSTVVSATVPRRSGWRPVGVAALVLIVLASAATLAGIVTGVIKLPGGAVAQGSPPPASSSQASTPPPSSEPPTPVPSFPAPAATATDPLTGPLYWTATSDQTAKTNKASCRFGPNGMTVAFAVGNATGTWRCLGPDAMFDDFQANVTVTLDKPGTCAAMWFRFQGIDHGYVVRVCQDRVALGTHQGSFFTGLAWYPPPSSSLSSSPSASPSSSPAPPLFDVGQPYRFSIYVKGNLVVVSQCDPGQPGCVNGRVLLSYPTATSILVPGTFTLGLFQSPTSTATRPYQATFSRLEIYTSGTKPIPTPSRSAPSQ